MSSVKCIQLTLRTTTVLVILLTLIGTSFATNGRTFCSVSKPTKVEDTTALSCFFSQNLQEKQDEFCVRRVDAKNRVETIVLCKWTDRKADCRVKDGYIMNDKVDYEVHVKAVTNETAGTRFLCNTIPPLDDTLVQDCTVTQDDSPQSVVAGVAGEPASGTDKPVDGNPATESPTNSEDENDASVKVVICVCLAVSAAFNVVVILLVIYKRMASNNGKPMKTPKHQPQGRYIFWVCLSSCSKSNSHLPVGEQGETACIKIEDNLSTELDWPTGGV